MSSIMTQSFRRNVLSSCKVLFFQQPKYALGNSNSYLFQSSHSRYYANSTFPSPSPQVDSTSNKFLEQFKKDIANRLPAAILKFTLTGIVGGIAIAVDLFIAWYRNSFNERLLNKTLEKGTRPEIGVLEDMVISRPEIIERLKKILLPDKYRSSYHVVCGEYGTGKTTLTKIASREVGQDKKRRIQGGRGVIYINTPNNVEDFGIEFGKALNYTFEEPITISMQLINRIMGYTNYNIKGPKWKRAMKAFKRAAAVYKKKNPYHQPPVIVYDNINLLAHKNPEILDFLQDDAKNNADDHKYIAVFVSSEGSVLRKMQSRSAWSRADDPIEIGDLTKEESLNYLIEKRRINKVEAEKIYELIGGRIVDLNTTANKIQEGNSFNDIKEKTLNKIEDKLRAAKLLKGQDYHIAGKKIIKTLIDSKELRRLEFEKCFEKFDDADKVLENNVFAYHPERNTVTFQSRIVEYYIQKNKYLFGFSTNP